MTAGVRTLAVNLGEILVGYLTHYPDERTVFFVDQGYRDLGTERPLLSLSLARPGDEQATQRLLADGRHKSSLVRAPPFFSNLLPEGGLRRRVAAELKVHEDREFDLLLALGNDLPGAVMLSPVATPAHVRDGRGDVVDGPPKVSPELKSSLGGMQLKFSMLRQGERFTLPSADDLGDFIVKPPAPEFEALPRVEAATMATARQAGIDVPEVHLVSPDAIDGLSRFSGFPASEPFYAVRRYDRSAAGRTHAEDFAQVFNLRPSEKYGRANYEQIGRTLLRYAGGLEDLREMVRRLVFNVVIGNGDAHIKNWSLLYQNPLRPRLSPAYDLVPTVVYASDRSAALGMGGVKAFQQISLATIDRSLQRVGLLDQVREDLQETAMGTARAVAANWEDEFQRHAVPPQLIDRLRDYRRDLPLAREAG